MRFVHYLITKEILCFWARNICFCTENICFCAGNTSTPTGNIKNAIPQEKTKSLISFLWIGFQETG